MSQENFSELLQENLTHLNMRPGSIVQAKVIYIDEAKKLVVLDAGLKTYGVIPLEQFYDEEGSFDLLVGEEIDVMIEMAEDGAGETRLSREKARRAEDWQRLTEAFDSGEYVECFVEKAVKGGVTVALKPTVKAFLPGSLVDVRPVRDLASLVGERFMVKIVKIDEKRNNMVVSRREVIEKEQNLENQVAINELDEGQEMDGVIKNLTDYGVFVDLGGIDGLLHITDIAWKRVGHPSEMFNVGDKARVKILKIDREKGRVSLGIKQLTEDPWLNLIRRYPVNTRLFGKVTNLTDYGCFVEIEDGIEGLVHMSEMDWTNKNIHPNKIVTVGKEVEVMVLDVDEGRRRVSLGMKQCQDNPWDAFTEAHKEGDFVKGEVKSITDFGIFIGLDGEIDGLVHLSDIAWNRKGEEAVRDYQKGQEVEAVILGMDPERERISLGIKQLCEDPNEKFLEAHPRGSKVTAKVIEVDAKRALLEINDETKAQLLVSDFSEDFIEDLSSHVSIDQELELFVAGVDKRTMMLSLSVTEPKEKKAPRRESSSVSIQKSDQPKATTLGDLIKQQMKNDKDNDN